LHDIHCTIYIVRYTLHDIHCTIYIVRYTLYDIHCTIYIVRYKLYDIHCTIYIVRYTLYDTHCTMYIVRYTLYDIHCTIYIPTPNKLTHFRNILFTNFRCKVSDKLQQHKEYLLNKKHQFLSYLIPVYCISNRCFYTTLWLLSVLKKLF